MKKSNLFLVTALVLSALAGCQDDVLTSSEAGGKATSSSDAIAFNSYKKAMTKATTAMNETHDNFGVWGFYERINTDNLNQFYIMDNYVVKYSETEAGSTWGDGANAVDGASYWYYDGLTNDDGIEQSLKYWNGSTNNSMWTFFMGYAPYTKEAEYKMTGNSDVLTIPAATSFYTAPVEQIDGITETDDDDVVNKYEVLYDGTPVFQTSYGNDVQMEFEHADARIKFAFWKYDETAKNGGLKGYDVEFIDLRPANTVAGGPQFTGYDTDKYLNDVTPQVRDAIVKGSYDDYKVQGSVSYGTAIHNAVMLVRKSAYPEGLTADQIEAVVNKTLVDDSNILTTPNPDDLVCVLTVPGEEILINNGTYNVWAGNDYFWGYMYWFVGEAGVDSDDYLIASAGDDSFTIGGPWPLRNVSTGSGGIYNVTMPIEAENLVWDEDYDPANSTSSNIVLSYGENPSILYSDFCLVPAYPNQAAWPTADQLKNAEAGTYQQEYGTTTTYQPGTEFFGQTQWYTANTTLADYVKKAETVSISNVGANLMYNIGMLEEEPAAIKVVLNDTTKTMTNLRFKKPTGALSTDQNNPTYSETVYYPLPHNYTEDNVGFTLKVSYKLIPKDGTASVNVYDARIYIAPEYCNWEAGKQYTYVIRIGNETTGTTNPGKCDPNEPVKPYIDPDDPRIIDDKALKPIIFEPGIKDYDESVYYYFNM